MRRTVTDPAAKARDLLRRVESGELRPRPTVRTHIDTRVADDYLARVRSTTPPRSTDLHRGTA
jgi:hypothetical protein